MTPIWTQEEEMTPESFSGHAPLWFDTGERDGGRQQDIQQP